METSPVTTALSLGPCPSFPRLASRYLGEYLEKIRYAVERLDEGRIWWRPARGVNSIGNLLLHLAGNLSLWIGQGVGGRPYDRDRAGEFAADSTHGRGELLERLGEVVGHCQWVLEQQEGADLARPLDIQGYRTDLQGAVFHAVEHMSYHTGQVLTLSKQILDREGGLELYPQHRGE